MTAGNVQAAPQAARVRPDGSAAGRFFPLLRGRVCACRAIRAGGAGTGCRRLARGVGHRKGFEDGEDRLNDLVDQGNQHPRQPRAALRGDALGELAEWLG